jgi:hypothetical protein
LKRGPVIRSGERIPVYFVTPRLAPWIVFRLATAPSAVFAEIAKSDPSAASVFFGASLWYGLAPPVFAYIGAAHFGWITGAAEPLFLSTPQLLSVSIAYFVVLLCGFVLTAAVSQWMAATYGARRSLGVHLALITIVGAPLALGSVAHLYPHMVFNFLVLVPMLIWSLYLLYSGLPVALGTDRERGMLMASSLVAFLLVAAVSLLGLTAALWTEGIGPSIWI